MSDNKSLVVGVQQHLTTQVKAANIQLLISSQLTQDIERRRFVEILKSINKVKAVNFLSRVSCLNEDLIKKHEDNWEWEWLSTSDALPWSIELIKKFKLKWDWGTLSCNGSLPWTMELIEKCKSKWDWGKLSCNGSLPWSIELIAKFKDKWNWKV